MQIKINSSWKKLLSAEFEKSYFKNLIEFVDNEYQHKTIYPPKDEIFSAFEFCKFDKLKVVIIGQDPYHGQGQANGLCFSVKNGIRKPPSLLNIFKELKEDINKEIPENGDLTFWAKQGVLLINATLTVEASKPTSHQKKGWEIFTDAVIKNISNNKENVVFLLWGNYARNKEKIINEDKHFILKSAHPSPLSAFRGFFGNKHFSKTNEFLKSKSIQEIIW